jgi:hypothetical protein
VVTNAKAFPDRPPKMQSSNEGRGFRLFRVFGSTYQVSDAALVVHLDGHVKLGVRWLFGHIVIRWDGCIYRQAISRLYHDTHDNVNDLWPRPLQQGR